eukprot:COSAG02_NODE_210_length_28878_cov_133.787136_9_plen_511_part_00
MEQHRLARLEGGYILVARTDSSASCTGMGAREASVVRSPQRELQEGHESAVMRRQAVPRIGTKVNVEYSTGPSEGIVAYVDGTKIWVAYPEMLDCPLDRRATWCHRNLAVLVKPGNPANYRLSSARLRRLAVSGGIAETGPSTTAYDAVVWHEPIDWAVQKQRATVTIMDTAREDIDHSTVCSRKYSEEAYPRGARARKHSLGSPRSADYARLLDQLQQYIEESAPKSKLTVFRNSLSSRLTGVESKLQNARYNGQRLPGKDVARLREFLGSQQEQDKFLAGFAPDMSEILQKDQEEVDQQPEQAACGAQRGAVSEAKEYQEDTGSVNYSDDSWDEDENVDTSDEDADSSISDRMDWSVGCARPLLPASWPTAGNQATDTEYSVDEDENVGSSDDDRWSASDTEESGKVAITDRARRRPPVPPVEDPPPRRLWRPSVADPPPRRLWRLTPLQTVRARVGSVSNASMPQQCATKGLVPAKVRTASGCVALPLLLIASLRFKSCAQMSVLAL